MRTVLVCNNNISKGIESLQGRKPFGHNEVIGYGYLFENGQLSFEGALLFQPMVGHPRQWSYQLQKGTFTAGCALVNEIIVKI